eukprot:s678_g14.t1
MRFQLVAISLHGYVPLFRPPDASLISSCRVHLTLMHVFEGTRLEWAVSLIHNLRVPLQVRSVSHAMRSYPVGGQL